MKYIFFLFFILTFACKKNETPIEETNYWGEGTALQNGENWLASRNSTRTNKFTTESTMNINFGVIDVSGFLVESLRLKKLPTMIGNYPVVISDEREDDGKVGAKFSFKDDDVSLAHYDILEWDSANYIKVESYDTETEEVQGIFELTFVISEQYDSTQEFPDTIRFRNGIFHTKVIDL